MVIGNPDPMSGPKLDPRIFREFCELIYQLSGIRLGDGKEALVASRLAKRLRALKLPDYRAYLEFVRNDETGEEIVQMLDVISTNVTSFFREPQHFEFMRRALEEFKNAGQRKYRVWCAASSTGEEPYTIAMTMADVLGFSVDWKILATDISTRVLKAAQEGVYKQASVGTVPPTLKHRFLEAMPRASKDAPPTFRVAQELKDRIVFKRLNLAEPPFPMHGPLDFVFCRNVMIYFDNAIRSGLLNEVVRLLRPGGYLMVGHSESLTGMLINLKPVQPSTYVKPG